MLKYTSLHVVVVGDDQSARTQKSHSSWPPSANLGDIAGNKSRWLLGPCSDGDRFELTILKCSLKDLKALAGNVSWLDEGPKSWLIGLCAFHIISPKSSGTMLEEPGSKTFL